VSWKLVVCMSSIFFMTIYSCPVLFACTEVACMLSLAGLFEVCYYYYIAELLINLFFTATFVHPRRLNCRLT